MKRKLPMGVCVLICLALVLGGLTYGVYSGFEQDRREAVRLLDGENGLMDALSYRGADGLNLCAVADRHLSGSENVEALRALSRRLADGDQTPEAQSRDAEELKDLFDAVLQELRQTGSFLQSQRDVRYGEMLESDLKSLSENELFATYNAAAQEFNHKLETNPLGMLAGLLGVKPCELLN